MTLILYGHPFSSYSQKAQIALYEKDLPFDFRVLGPDAPESAAEWAELWPLKRFPVLVDSGRSFVEASIIVEHVDQLRPGDHPLLPRDPDAALEVRMLDRFFDNYIMSPMQKIVGDRLRVDNDRDPYGVTEARTMLDTAYAWLEGRIGDGWAAGGDFSLADCAAAPSLFYADWSHPMNGRFPAVAAYRERLLRRPSVSRAVDVARPFRAFFPLGAPDRD